MGKKKKAKYDRYVTPHHDGAPQVGSSLPPPLAGIAAAMARQIATPAGRQMIAAGLVAAAGAIAGRDGPTPTPPRPPAPPVPPAPPASSEGPASATPAFETPPLAMPPEAARIVGAAASALERWVQGLAKPPKSPAE